MSDEVAETSFETEATASAPDHPQQSALANRVAPDFFRALGIPLLAGRDFTSADALGKSPVFVVNESLAKKYFGSSNAVGKRFSTEMSSGHFIWGQIVGVVGNVRETTLRDNPKPQVYAPFYQSRHIVGVFLLVRSSSASQNSVLSLVPALQDRIWSIDKNQPITSVATLDQRLAEVNASPRSQTLLLGIFAALGFLLALIGVYGVMSYLVGLQTREIGIRMALGASPSQVLRRILAHSLKLTAIGILLGLAGGIVLTRFMSNQLLSISPNDPPTYAAVALFLLAVSVAASYAPARRASLLNPTTALRHE